MEQLQKLITTAEIMHWANHKIDELSKNVTDVTELRKIEKEVDNMAKRRFIELGNKYLKVDD